MVSVVNTNGAISHYLYIHQSPPPPFFPKWLFQQALLFLIGSFMELSFQSQQRKPQARDPVLLYFITFT